MKKKYLNKIKVYNTFNEEEKNTYYQDLDNIINDIKKVINSTDYERKILKDIEEYMNKNNSNESGNHIGVNNENNKSDEKGSNNINNNSNNNSIGIEFISGTVSKKNIQHSKY